MRWPSSAASAPTRSTGLSPKLAPVRQQMLPASLPADLLGRRADLVAQRWRVDAASRQVDGGARRSSIRISTWSAFAGLSSLGLDKLVRAGSATYGIGPALHLPIFDGGRLRANLRARSAEVDAAVEAYNAALLARAARSRRRSQPACRRSSASRRRRRGRWAAEAAFDLATQRYRAGLGNFLVVPPPIPRCLRSAAAPPN